ncbi:MAG: hypothetical protein FJ145_21385 [Deltaproteobacteria bacterium]|nr:hypothetical protein [Deltaproteobacteria bacterium]
MPRQFVRWVLAIVLVVIAACSSETFTEIEKDRAPLIGGLESYSTRDEIIAKLPPQAETKVIEDTSRHKPGSQPPYQVYVVKVSSYEHLKHSGYLSLTFFNNRFMQAAFYPDKRNDYIAALRASGVAVKTGTEYITGHTVVWIGSDFDNKPYIGWADDRLRAQQRRWLSKYS